MTTNYTCIVCPMGCPLTLDDSDRQNVTVTGQKCPRGKSYAIEEHSDPKRVITTTVQSNSPAHPRIPVKTDRAIQKQYIGELLQHLDDLEITLPVKCGDVLVSDFRNTGVRVLVARSFSEAPE